MKHAKSPDRDGFLYKAMNKYGLENFKISMLEEVDNNKLNEREIYYIALYKATQKRFGYNMTEGGNGISSLSPESEKLQADKISKALSGRKQSAELIEKRTAKLSGQKRTPEQRMRLSIAHKGKSHKGTPCSEEWKEKLRQANLGKKQSEETKQKRRLSMSKLKWFNNGQISLRADSCPEGFKPGRLKINYTPEGLAASSHKGTHWYTNGMDNVMGNSCPEGFHPGRTNKPKDQVLNNLEDEND